MRGEQGGRSLSAGALVVLAAILAIVAVMLVLLPSPSRPAGAHGSTTAGVPPTSGTRAPPATAAQVRRFVALASLGQSATFSAEYDVSWPNGTSEVQLDAQDVAALRYTVLRGSTPAEAFIWDRRSGRSYDCTRATSSGPWSCQSPSSGNAFSLLVGHYEPKALLGALVEAVTMGGHWTLSSRLLDGRQLRCLDLGTTSAPTASWCITAAGLFGYWSSSVSWPQTGAGTATLTDLRTSVVAGDFVRPSTGG